MRSRYSLPDELSRHAPGSGFGPEELREVCLGAGESLGKEDAAGARFRSAAETVALWRGRDLPAWEAPYVLRDARLGYLKGYDQALASGGLSAGQIERAAEVRWGEAWPKRLKAVRERAER